MYAKHVSLKNTPVTEKAKPNQVKNNTGGYVFALDKWKTLERFLILGNEGGTYYCTERKMTQDNARCVLACAADNLATTLNTIVALRDRAPKQSPAIFALSLLISNGYDIGDTLNKVCKTGTQLFEFVANCNELRGWGARLKQVVSNWYLNKDAKSVAYQVTKYANRNGWTHRDVLRLCHAKTSDGELNDVFKYVCQNEKWQSSELETDTNDFLAACQEAKQCDVERALFLIEEYGLVREHLNTAHLNDVRIWDYLLKDMPMIAMLRNLGKMSSVGLLNPLSEGSKQVLNKLGNDNVQKSRVHPLTVLTAYTTYGAGRGLLGSNSWNVNQNIVAALDKAFYASFTNIVPCNKRFYLGIDCSGSMSGGSIGGTRLTPVMGAAVMAMSTIKSEPYTYNKGFNHTMVEIGLNSTDCINSCINKILKTPWGSTDCSLPMEDAIMKKLEVDCFVCYTDNEVNTNRHPFQSLKKYRDKTGINAKLIVVGMTATGFSIADPSDAGMLDVVGFDTNCPSVISEFCS